jgi:class 3 adenylate cyclase
VSELRLASVQFADLVGFTTLSEHREPDEVRELLSRYFDRCRGEVLDALITADQLTLVEELLANAAHDELPVTRAQLQRARGVLLAWHGEFAEAESKLAQAATTLRSAGNPFELARTLLDDGRVLIELGRTGEATAVLQKASSLFAKLGTTPWLDRTKRLLDPAAITTE